MSERPTPTTSAMRRKYINDEHPESYWVDLLFAEMGDLERQLADACEQRDRLAEALESVKRRAVIAGSTGEYRRGQIDALHACSGVADSALAAVKGGSHE